MIRFRDKNDPILGIAGRKEPALVVGLGRSGIAAANLLKKAGCPVEINDVSARQDFIGDFSELHPDVRIHWGGHPTDLFTAFPLVVVSPGVPTDLPALETARQCGALVIGEMELAYRCTSMPWVAITGSNGKSTTTTMVGLFAQGQRIEAAVGGNLGTPATELAVRKLSASWLVAEVSSFQLETVERFHPALAAFLNISPDHLDRYRRVEDYISAKAELFDNMTVDDTVVLNLDDPQVVDVAGSVVAVRFPFARKSAPAPGVALSGRTLVVNDEDGSHPVIEVDDIGIKGTHNLENAMAAVAVGWKMGVTAQVMARELQSFTGLPHRMELVAHSRGVPVYNDSKGTNVGATLRSLGGMGRDVILIMGGKDKGASYRPLADLVERKVSMLVLMGEAAEAIEMQLSGLARIVRARDMNDAVRLSLASARPGSQILLSPACSSFDMYHSFEERGDDFRAAVLHYLGMS